MKTSNYITVLKFIPIYALSILPLSVLYLFSDLTYLLLYRLVKYRKGVVRDNLKRSFPEKSYPEIKAIEKKFYRHFCDIMIESIKILTIRKKDIRNHFIVKNPELIQKYFNEKRSIVLYTAHQGNWEWLSFLPLFIPHQATAFYQPLANKYIDDFMKLIRERFGVLCIESDKGYKAIIQFAQKGILTLNFIIGDQCPRKRSTKHWTQFLNQETAFLIGADRIAKKSNQVVIFPSFSKKKRGCYELEFKVIEEDVKKINSYDIIDKYAKLLEKTIVNSPELWLWSHKRWKLSKK